LKKTLTERVLVVAAHPDDEVLGCGGTIAKMRSRGCDVRVVFLAEGITARYVPEQFTDPDVLRRIAKRNANALKALAILGVPSNECFVGSRYCCRLDQVPLIDLTKEIESHIREFRPTMMLTHATDDTNVDHGMVHRAVLAAARPLQGQPLRTLCSFEILSSTEWNPPRPFAPTLFHDITGFIDTKIAALAAYEDEMLPSPHPRSPEVLRALATYRGAQAGLKFAEGFALIRAIEE
jgi:LmbE family N-acetylglucosaminyl deacetylase